MILKVLVLLAIASVFVLLPWRSNRYQKFIYWFFLIPLILLAGLRDIGVDQDSIGYVQYYNSADLSNIVEPTFVFISQLVKYLFDDVQYLFLIYAIIGISLKFFAINKLTDLLIATMPLYISKLFLFYDLNVIRAGVSCSILLLAIIPLSNRKFYQFFILAFIATLFHYSAILLFPLYFLTNRHLTRIQKYFLYSIVPLSYLIYFLDINLIATLPIPLIQEKIQIYSVLEESGTDGMSNVNVFNLFQIAHCLFLYYLLYFYEYLYPKCKHCFVCNKSAKCQIFRHSC